LRDARLRALLSEINVLAMAVAIAGTGSVKSFLSGDLIFDVREEDAWRFPCYDEGAPRERRERNAPQSGPWRPVQAG
jgi:DNA helicase HerA-like ATPase